MLDLEGIDHVALAVRDPQRTAEWYRDLLGFERWHAEMWNGVPLFIGKGTTALALFPIRDGSAPSSARVGLRMLHLAFRTTREGFAQAQKELNTRGIDFEFQDHEISHSIYFRDPDGFELEITTYEV